MAEKTRPPGITILAILFLLAALFGIGDGLVMTLLTGNVLYLLLLPAIGIVTGAVGFGLLFGIPLARTAAVILELIVIMLGICMIVIFGNAVYILVVTVHLVIVLYLFKKNVRTYFGVWQVPI